MPRKKENSRITTYNKLINAGKSSEKDILNLKIEDLENISNDIDIKNIIFLRKCIRERNTIEYFNYKQTRQGEEEQ